jgi:hypothetical protein
MGARAEAQKLVPGHDLNLEPLVAKRVRNSLSAGAPTSVAREGRTGESFPVHFAE